MWYRQLHWQIIIGLILGVLFGLLASMLGWVEFVQNWIKPWGTIFINLLKLVAVPLVVASLIAGVANLSDLSKLSRIGGKTIGLYVGTTAVAVTIGLTVVNLLQPGKGLPPQMRQELMESYASNVEQSTQRAEEVQQVGPLQPIVDIVPENFVRAASDNRNMLQIVFFALLIGIGLIGIERTKAEPVRAFFDGLNEVIIRIVDLIMRMAPVGVFALIAGVLIDLAGSDPVRALNLLRALAWYGLTVVVGLILHTFGTYAVLLRTLSPIRLGHFYRAIRPAMVVAFSTSSSAATLPVTMERCERGLGVSKEIASFTLPLGATINMDGTVLYQAVAAVFIAQVLGMELGLLDQLTIVLTATLASIGAAPVPGAGVIMLVIILQSVHVPVEGIALILGIDRILDMCRTVTNITGDATVTFIVAHSEGKLHLLVEEEALRSDT